MIWVKRGAFALVGVLLLAVVLLATWEPFFASAANPAPGRTYTAEIIRDEFGVPHIYGKTDADTAYGVAIAHAEDDFFTLQDVVAMARGRYGAIAGEEGAQIDYAYHLIDARGTAEREYPKLPADTRALFEAYAAGLNQYATEHSGEVKLANLFPVNGMDVAAGFALRQPFFFGLDGVIGPLVAGEELRREHGPDIPGFPRPPLPVAEPAPAPAPAAPATDQARRMVLPLGEDAEHLGSNAFAVAPKKSGGPTTLISNSHQPLRGGVAWYELVVESGEGWHFAGANFPGSPFPFLGHNEHLGWTNTVNTPDMIDVYQLELDETGTRYKLDGEWRDLESKWVTLPVKIGPVVLPIRKEVLRSAHGPVIKNAKGAFAIRYGGIGQLGQLDAYYRINKATNFAEWEAQLSRLAIPSTNFIYADEAGTIAYVYNAAIPRRPEGVKADWRNVLPGDRSDLIWQGAVDYASLPRIVNPASGWLYNSNNTPFTAAGAGSDLDGQAFAPLMGIELKQTNRSWRAYKLLSEASVLDRAALERIKYDTGYERLGYVDRLFDTLEGLKAEGKLAEARDLLLSWDFTADGKGAADAIALLIIRDFMSADYNNKPFPDVAEKLQAATDHLTTHFGRLDPPMGDLLRLRQGELDLPLDGGSDTLRASTTWDVAEDGRLSLKHGDSFIMWIEWQPGQRVTSRSIQPFGAATTRPASPHYTDQMQLFVDHKLKPVHFWRDDLLAKASKSSRRDNHGHQRALTGAFLSHDVSPELSSMTHRFAAASLSALALALAVPFAPALAQTAPAASAAPQATADLPTLVSQVTIPYQQFELENGLTVLVHEDRKAPIVNVTVWYNVGSKDEPEGKTGFAHLFEHLMFNGSENAPDDYFKYLAEMGATDYNGTTWFDRTNYFQTVPRPALERALWLESDRMGYLLGAVTQGKLDNQRGVVQNEKRQGDNEPGGLVFYDVLKTLFPDGHPYQHEAIGSMADLDSASMEDVKAWFTENYGPNNATLVIAGDISAAEAKPLVEKYFGTIARGPVNDPAQADVPTLKEPVRKTFKDQVAATSVTRYWPVEGITGKDRIALDVGASILGGLASSRLDNVLVRDEQLAVSVSAGNSAFHRIGILQVEATAKEGVELAVLEKRMDEVVAKLIAEGPTEDEVRRAVTSNLARTIRGLEQVGGFSGKAQTLAEGEVLAGDPQFYAREFEALAKLTPADVKAALGSWMTRPAMTVVLEPGARDATYEEAASVAAEGENASERDRAAETITVSAVRPAPPIDSIAQLDFPDVERATLKNGMKVTYARRTAVPATYVSMAFNAGGAADPAGKTGLDGLTLSLFDEGTKNLSAQQIAEAGERLGATVSVGGGDDRSTFTLSALTANLAPSLDLMRQIMREPAFNPEDLERVRNQTITGLRQAMKSPQGIAQLTLTPELFGANSPYGRVPTVASVSSITRDDLIAHKDSWIRPDNGEVFVISDKPLAEIVTALNAAFGDWTPPATPKGTKQFADNMGANGNRIILVNRPNSPQSFILGSQITPLDAGDPAFVAFGSANKSLGGDFLARLNMNLRETKGWSYGVRGGAQARENAVVYSISGGVQADRTGDSLAEMLRETKEFLTIKGVTPEELERNVASDVGSLPGRFETSPAVLGAMQSNALFGRPDNYQETLASIYTAQTPATLDAIARASIDADKFVWVVVGDASVVRAQLEPLGLPIEQREMEGE